MVHHGQVWLHILSLRSNAPRARTAVLKVHFRSNVMCGGGSTISCVSSCSTISPHGEGVNKEMHSKAMMVRVSRLWSCKVGGLKRVSLDMHMEAVIMQTWRLYSSQFGHTLGSCDWTSLQINLEAKMEWNWRSISSRSIWMPLFMWAVWREPTLYSLVNL